MDFTALFLTIYFYLWSESVRVRSWSGDLYRLTGGLIETLRSLRESLVFNYNSFLVGFSCCLFGLPIMIKCEVDSVFAAFSNDFTFLLDETCILVSFRVKGTRALNDSLYDLPVGSIFELLWFLVYSLMLLPASTFSSDLSSIWFSFSYFWISAGTSFCWLSKQSLIFLISDFEIHYYTKMALWRILAFLFSCWCLVSLPCDSKSFLKFCVIKTMTDFNCLCIISIYRSCMV